MQADVTHLDLTELTRPSRIPPRARQRALTIRAQRGIKLAGSLLFLAAGLGPITALLSQAPRMPAERLSERLDAKPLGQAAVTLSPQAIMPLSATDARAANAAIPLGTATPQAGMPLDLLGHEPGASQALDCLTTAIYYEAGSEPADGKRAVAQVVLNRVRHPAFPATVCGVIFQGAERRTGCQFSFTCDGSLRRQPLLSAWLTARAIAIEALSGHVFAPVGLATHYHADYVLPYWAPTLSKNLVVGRHIFYQWNGSWGRPTAFVQRYAGREPQISVRHDLDESRAPAMASATSSTEERNIIDLDGASLDTSLAAPSALAEHAAANSTASAVTTQRYVIALEALPLIKVSLATP